MSTAMKIVIVGNCQARPLSEMLTRAVPGLDLGEAIIIHLAREEEAQANLSRLAEADAVLTQLVADNYPVEHLRTNRLKAAFGDRVVVWPNVFFGGQNPDLAYVSHANGRLLSPMGPYHSRALFEAWREGLPLQEVSEENYVSRSRTVESFRDAVAKSFDELETRERETDVGILDEIRRLWQSEALFHTFNHPHAALLAELARRIASRLDLALGDPATLTSAPDRLAAVQPPMERALADALGLEYAVTSETLGVEVSIDNGKVVTGASTRHAFEDFARLSYACYDAQASSSDEVRFTPAY